MKKVLTIGLMLLVCAGFVFAADDGSDTLKVKLEVGGSTSINWFTAGTEPTLDNWDTLTQSQTDTSLAENAIDISSSALTAFPAVKTNNVGTYTITVTGTPLTSTTVDTVITLKASIGEDQTATWSSVSTDDTLTISESEQGKGNRVLTKAITIEADSDTKELASAANNYTATLTMTVSHV